MIYKKYIKTDIPNSVLLTKESLTEDMSAFIR